MRGDVTLAPFLGGHRLVRDHQRYAWGDLSSSGRCQVTFRTCKARKREVAHSRCPERPDHRFRTSIALEPELSLRNAAPQAQIVSVANIPPRMICPVAPC